MGDIEPPPPAPPTGRAKEYILSSRTQLCRIYDHTSGYGPFDWNRTLRGTTKADRDDGGRFDATLLTAGPPGYIYGAECQSGADIAVVETLLPLVKWKKRENSFAISAKHVRTRSIVHFQVSRDLRLVDLRDGEGRGIFHARAGVTTSRRRDLTRQWGDYIRTHAPNAQGIAFNSSQLGASSEDVSFVLFERTCKGLGFIDRPPIQLSSKAGYAMWHPVLSHEGVLYR